MRRRRKGVGAGVFGNVLASAVNAGVFCKGGSSPPLRTPSAGRTPCTMAPVCARFRRVCGTAQECVYVFWCGLLFFEETRHKTVKRGLPHSGEVSPAPLAVRHPALPHLRGLRPRPRGMQAVAVEQAIGLIGRIGRIGRGRDWQRIRRIRFPRARSGSPSACLRTNPYPSVPHHPLLPRFSLSGECPTN